ncbi:MAG: hypothetical protein ACYS91_17460, partial [Planctomycetota bacterium]
KSRIAGRIMRKDATEHQWNPRGRARSIYRLSQYSRLEDRCSKKHAGNRIHFLRIDRNSHNVVGIEIKTSSIPVIIQGAVILVEVKWLFVRIVACSYRCYTDRAS